ncbi:MAG: hypothetical protein IPG61_19285 [bacterium]|nr:hypothetical protein [bacterium]
MIARERARVFGHHNQLSSLADRFFKGRILVRREWGRPDSGQLRSAVPAGRLMRQNCGKIAAEGTLKRIAIDPKYLIPTDCPRSLTGILRFIPVFCARENVNAIVVIASPPQEKPANAMTYLVCSGNHRAAAAFICGTMITADVIEVDDDIPEIREGSAAGCDSVTALVSSCLEAAESGGYLTGRWEEYLRMITDSGVVGYNESDTAHLSESALRRGARRAP